MPKEFIESYREDGLYIEVYKDEDGYILEAEEDDDDEYEDIYGPTDVSGNYSE